MFICANCAVTGLAQLAGHGRLLGAEFFSLQRPRRERHTGLRRYPRDGLLIQEAGGLIGDLAGDGEFLHGGQVIAATPKIFAQMVTALAPRIGYDAAAAIAKESVATGKTVRELCVEKQILPPAELAAILDPYAQTEGGIVEGATAGG